MTLELSDIRDERLADELRSRGWRCIRDDDGADWETPGKFSLRHGHHKNYLCHIMRKGVKPPGLETTRGPTGRILFVRTTPETERWMKTRISLNKPVTPKHNRQTTSVPGFEQFWSAYPRHAGKADAANAWKTMACDKIGPRLFTALEKCAKSESWTKEGGKFIPYPATWLRRGGWEDELPPASKGKVATHALRPEQMPAVTEL